MDANRAGNPEQEPGLVVNLEYCIHAVTELIRNVEQFRAGEKIKPGGCQQQREHQPLHGTPAGYQRQPTITGESSHQRQR